MVDPKRRSLLGAKPTLARAAKMSFLTLHVTSPPSIAAVRKDRSITSSARASSVNGMGCSARPVQAVLRSDYGGFSAPQCASLPVRR